MNDRDALLAAIRGDPDDDTPRLVFADWLEEHGENARAEFIRLQIELARHTGDQERQPFLDREWELLKSSPELRKQLAGEYRTTFFDPYAAHTVNQWGIGTYDTLHGWLKHFDTAIAQSGEQAVRVILLELLHCGFERGFCYEARMMVDQAVDPEQQQEHINRSPQPLSALHVDFHRGTNSHFLGKIDATQHPIRRVSFEFPSAVPVTTVANLIDNALLLLTVREVHLNGLRALGSGVAQVMTDSLIPKNLQILAMPHLDRGVNDAALRRLLAAPNLRNVVLLLSVDEQRNVENNPTLCHQVFRLVSRSTLIELDQHNLRAAQHHGIEYHTPEPMLELIGYKKPKLIGFVKKPYSGVQAHPRIASMPDHGMSV